jgi:hypothetical protein
MDCGKCAKLFYTCLTASMFPISKSFGNFVKRVRISCVVFRNEKRIVFFYSFRRIMASSCGEVSYINLLVKIHRKTTKESMLFPMNTKSAMANVLDCINN